MSWTEREHLPDVKAERRNPQASPDAPVRHRRKKRLQSKPFLIEARAPEPPRGLWWKGGAWYVHGKYARKEDRDRELLKAKRTIRWLEFRARDPSEEPHGDPV